VVVTGSVGLDESTLVDEIFFVLCGISVLSITNNDNCNIYYTGECGWWAIGKSISAGCYSRLNRVDIQE
jgi:hypothetical protein